MPEFIIGKNTMKGTKDADISNTCMVVLEVKSGIIYANS